MLRNCLFACVLGVCLPACGGTVDSSPQQVGPEDGGFEGAAADAAPDAPAIEADADGPIDASADTGIDAPPADFCSGNAKASLHGVVAPSPTLTTSQLIMDCCQGGVVRFHAKAQLGVDLTVMVRGFGMLASGDYVLGDEPGNPEVEVGLLGQFETNLPTRGTLRVENDSDGGMRLGFCLETADGPTPGGARLFVPDVLVAPYAWDDRFRMFLLADQTLPTTEALKAPLDSHALAPEPVVSLMSLAYYEGSTHTAHWDNWSTTAALLSTLPQIPLQGLPFVVVADGQRIYMGSFMTMISSTMVNAPTIMVESMTESGFQITAPPQAPDPRADPRVLKALQESFKLSP